MKNRFVVQLCVLVLFGGLSLPGFAATFDDFLQQLHYREIGPTRQGGRVVSFAVAADDPTMFFVAAGPGGVWKTLDGGISYLPVFQQQSIASIGDIAIAPSDSMVVWIGSGEANLRNSTYYGNGVYKSVDGGARWQHMGLPESHHIGRILIHPEDANTVYVAAQGHLYSQNAERGVFKSTDGGETWSQSLQVSVDGRQIGATDIRFHPNNPDVLFAVAYDRQRMPWGFRTAGPGSSIYKSEDAGGTWRKLSGGLPSGMLGKIGIDVSRTNPDTLYATVDNANIVGQSDAARWSHLKTGLSYDGDTIGHEIYRSDDAGETWHKVSAAGQSIGSRSNYYGQIIVDPSDPDHLYVLSSMLQESRDGGATWRQGIRYAGDNHVLWINPDDSRHMLLGYDYGMAITRDAGQNWYHPDELSMAQIYAVGVDNDRPYNVYVGMQDFGSWKGPNTKKGRFPLRFEDWEHVNGGDGFYNQVDPADSRWLYSSSQFGHVTRIDQKTGSRKTIVDDEDEQYRYNWNTPFLISSHDSDVLFVGAQKLRRSDSKGDSWQDISGDLTKSDTLRFGGVGAVRYGTITSIDQSALDDKVLWVGTDDGNVQVTLDGGENWELLNANIAGFPDYWVTRVSASRHRPGTAYVTATGFHHDDFRPYVYRTDDFGKSWRSITAGLPDESANVIKEDHRNPNLLFLGTDQSVYASIDSGENWSRLQNNMPTIPVHDLLIHSRDSDLVVGTHGRGVYIMDVSPLQQLTAEVLNQPDFLFEIEPTVQWHMTRQPTVSAQNYSGENASSAVDIYYYLEEAIAADLQIVIYDGESRIMELSGTNKPGLNRVQWFMTRSEPRASQEQVEWQRQKDEIEAEGEFFDYYDIIEIFPEPGVEVDRYGRSLETRVHPEPGLTSKDTRFFRVSPGNYRIELQIGNKSSSTEAQVLSDDWFDR